MHQINVSVVYATPEKQWVYDTVVARGTSAQELIQLSGFIDSIPHLKEQQSDSLVIGVFAEKVSMDYLLVEGDRVEIYRPLTADPKDVRRKLALMGKTMSNK